MTTRSTRQRRALLLLTTLALLLAACGGGRAAPDPAADAAAATFPRTVQTDLGPVTIGSRPERIVAASTNAAEIALALVGPERLGAVPDYNLKDRHSPFAAEARQVGITVPGIGADPEALLAMDPDLVLITLAHDSEKDALELLQQAGVPTVALSRHPKVVEDVFADVTLIGEALGAEEAAAAYVKELQQRIEAVRVAVAGSDLEPRVVFISMWTDKGPYVTGPGTLNHDLIEIAGATNAIVDAGFTASGYLDPEQLVAAAPTHIVTRDPAGNGLTALTGGFLDGPGLAKIPAIAQGRILALPPAMFAASTAGSAGLEAMAAWLHDPHAARDER